MAERRVADATWWRHASSVPASDAVTETRVFLASRADDLCAFANRNGRLTSASVSLVIKQPFGLHVSIRRAKIWRSIGSFSDRLE